MDELEDNLTIIRAWLAEEEPGHLGSDSAYMTYTLDLMTKAALLVKVAAALAPDSATCNRGYVRNRAIVVGLQVRLWKLFHGFCTHVSNRELELASVLARLVYECAVKLEYLARAKRASFSSFVLVSYRADKHMLQDLNDARAARPLTPIEERIRGGIASGLRADGLTQKQLLAITSWKLDGKDFRAILHSLNRSWEYPYLFGAMSEMVHGSWGELRKYHLTKDGCYWHPNLEFSTPDPRLALPVTIVTMHATHVFLRWSKSDPNGAVLPLVDGLGARAQRLDQVHEQHVSSAASS